MAALAGIGGEERYWVHIPATKPRAYKKGGLVAAASAVKGSPMANKYGDSELVHVNKYEMEKLREMWGEPGINPETGLPAYGFFKVLGSIAKTVAKIGATVALTPVLGPVGAAAAVSAVDTAISGGNLGDIAKSAAFAGATAGAGQLGAKFAPSLGISSDVGRAVGAGLGATGAGVVSGQNIGDALTGGAMAGIGTYGLNRTLGSAINNNFLGIGDVYKGLTNFGYDISNATGIGGGGNYGSTGDFGSPGENIVVTAPQGTTLTYTGPTSVGPVTSASTSSEPGPQKYDENGNILVTANGTNLTLGPGTPQLTTGIGGGELNFDTEGNPIIATGTKNTDLTLSPDVSTAVNEAATDAKDYVPPADDILVTGTVGPGLTIPGSTTTTTTPKNVSVSNPYGTVMPFYDTGVVPAAEVVTPLVPRGGLFTERTMNRGLANIGFNPFTYGQAGGGQPGEFLFFTENGAPMGNVGEYTGPGAGIGGTAGGTTGSTTGGTGAGGGAGGGAGSGGAGGGGGSVTVSYNQKVGDKKVVDGKTYVWGGDKAGWQWLATNDKGEQVLMPSGGATSISSTEDMFKSGVARLSNEAEKARLAEIDRIMAATKAAPTAAAAREINPSGVYFDIDQATANAIGKPNLVGTQMSQRDLLMAKQAADDAARAATAAQIPTQVKAVQTAPTSGLSAQSYYNDYVSPLALSYYQTGKLNADQARGLTNAAYPFITSNDLSGAQNAVNNYLSTTGLAGPAMADGGEVDHDDMVSHLIAYHKNGGHQGPGHVKGIGSGQEDKIPAWLSDGEYVWSAQDVADLGDGSTDEGVRRLDKMRQMVRKNAGRKDVKKIAKPQPGIDKMLKAVGGAV